MTPHPTTARLAPISAPALTAEAHAHHAERMRAQLADFWGKPLRGIPYGMDLLRAMFITATATDLHLDGAMHYIDLCDNNAAAYRTSDVWVAPPSMGQRLATHPYLTSGTIAVGNLEDDAPARDGLVYFPTPITLEGLHPIYGLAWHMVGTGDDLIVDIETTTATRLIPTRLPPMLAAATKLPRTQYCPNGLATLRGNILNGYSNPAPFGAAGSATILALLLAFWDLRRPTTRDSPTAHEDIVSTPQHTTEGTKPRARRRGAKGKRPARAPRKRPIRIIHEPAHTPTASQPEPTADTNGPSWKDDTLRWEVSQKYQNRCPNPHQHRAIIEAGGECKPVRVPVRAHVNGPKGRDIDPRRAVRIVPDQQIIRP
ncbi:hypothetical protein [Streptomyces sp. NPDC051546]|uniref:hypothetical protein n=1 Tax=Streptomyces sp. NPDC051546 TaxID=3365655 RepID=UPI0037A335A6